MLLGFLLLLAAHSPLFAQSESQKLVALVDYIAGDYKNAVRAGTVINPDEYREMQELSARSLEIVQELKAPADQQKELAASLWSLALRIDRKEDEKSIEESGRRIRDRLIEIFQITPYPRSTPSLQAGKLVFSQNCAHCHGESGRGDGPSRLTLNPPLPSPTNFTDPEVMAGLSPFKVFNTATFGVEGTAMADFSALSEEERWQVAFHVLSLRFPNEAAERGKALFQERGAPAALRDLATLSSLSDEELLAKIREHFPDENEAADVLAYLRLGLAQEPVAGEPLVKARSLLREAMVLYEKGDKQEAYRKSVDAYLEGFDLAEPALFSRDASFGRALERKFAGFRGALKRGETIPAVRELHQEIDADLARAIELLDAGHRLGTTYAFLNSFAIIAREGLEAALILAAILAFLKMTGALHARKYIHLGWILATISGVLTWLAAQTLLTLSGSHRESLEGLTTLTAAAVLFYVGYWLHTKSQAQKWRNFLESKVQAALSRKNILAFVGVSFFAVYREAFEVVLFYQALWLQTSHARQQVVWGFVTGVACLAFVIFAILRLGLKIPTRHFFKTTGALLFLLAFIFSGQGTKELQTAEWVGATPLSLPVEIPFLGIYPTLETLLAQGLILVALLATLSWSRQGRPSAQPSPKQA